MAEEREKKDFLDSILNVVFSRDKTRLYVLLLVIAGFIARVIAAINLDNSADDVGHALIAIGIVDSGKLTVWSQSDALYYYLIDFCYKLFGATQFTSRLPAIVFGTASIFLIYILAKKFFNSDKIGLVAAFLLALSPWHVRNTLAEMDVAAIFFILLASIFIMKAMEEKERRNMILAGIAIGLGILTKLYVLFFAFSLFIFFIYMKRNTFKDSWKNLAIFTLIGFLLITPSITSNYLLYKDKGIVDFIPTNVFGIGKEKAAQYYSWDAGWNKKPDYIGFFTKTAHADVNLPGGLLTLRYLLYGDPIVFLLGFFGLFLAFKKNRNYFIFLLVMFIPMWFYISSVLPLSKHLLFETVLFIPLASFALVNFKHNLPEKIKLSHLLAIIFIINFILLGFHNGVASAQFYSKSSIGNFIDYKNANIPENALIIADSRIYRSRINWMMQNRYYIEASLAEELLNGLNDVNSTPVTVDVYFVECVPDDCGWGTIKDQPQFNATMEAYVNLFSNLSSPVSITYKPDKLVLPFMGHNEEIFRVYKAKLSLKPEIFGITEYTHSIYLYPIGYDEAHGEIFDNYQTHSTIGALLNKMAHIIFNIALVLSAMAIFVAIYLFIKEK